MGGLCRLDDSHLMEGMEGLVLRTRACGPWRSSTSLIIAHYLHLLFGKSLCKLPLALHGSGGPARRVARPFEIQLLLKPSAFPPTRSLVFECACRFRKQRSSRVDEGLGSWIPTNHLYVERTPITLPPSLVWA